MKRNMKTILLTIAILLLAAAMTLGGAQAGSRSAAAQPTAAPGTPPPSAETGMEVNATAPYGPAMDELLARYRSLIWDGGKDADPDVGETGVWEAIMGMARDAALRSVGYTLTDLSGDGMPELVIGAIATSDTPYVYPHAIYALYTFVDGQPHLTFEGWARNRYFYLGQNRFLNQGSSGAMYTSFGAYALSPDGQTLTCEDFYFTADKDENPEEMGLYHNTSGLWDKAVSGELHISEEAFWAIERKMEERIEAIELILFGE